MMTSKEYLRYIRSGTRRIDALKETKQRLYEAATSITAGYSGDVVAHSGESRKPEAYAVSLQDEQLEYWLTQIRAATEAIYAIHDPVLQSVLELHYINDMTWDEVAEHIHFSREYICRSLHPKALEAFIIPETGH